MIRFTSRLRLLSGLLLLLATAACGDGATRLTPTEPDRLLGLGGTLGGYHLANDPVLVDLLQTPLSLSKVIGFGGGTIELLGHKLVVPAGAVTQPTVFVVTVLPTGHVQVNLDATVQSLLGLLNIGHKGFKKPVPVTLTYSRSTNVPDPSELFVLRANGLFGQPEPLPSQVDPITKTVTAELDHFSLYFLAFP